MYGISRVAKIRYYGRFDVNRKVQDITANIAYFGPLLGTFIIMTTKFRHLKLVCVQKVSIKLVILPVMLNRLQQALLMLG